MWRGERGKSILTMPLSPSSKGLKKHYKSLKSVGNFSVWRIMAGRLHPFDPSFEPYDQVIARSDFSLKIQWFQTSTSSRSGFACKINDLAYTVTVQCKSLILLMFSH